MYPSGTAVGYSYTDGHLSAMTARVDDANVPIVQYVTAQPLGGIESWQYGNGLTRRFNRDLDARLTGVSVGTGTSLVQSLTYAYDASNQITAITNGLNAAYNQGYAYDALSRLTRVSRSNFEEYFDYNANGNRTSHRINNTLTTLTYDGSSNRLIRTDDSEYRQMMRIPGSPTPSLESVSYAYNAQGQRTVRRGSMDTTYHYSAFNRLAGVGLYGGVDTTYTYNALDQRVATSGYGQSADRFIYLGQNQMLGESRHGEWRDYLWFGDELVGFVDNGE